MYQHTLIPTAFHGIQLTLVIVGSLLSCACVSMPETSAEAFEATADANTNNYLKAAK